MRQGRTVTLALLLGAAVLGASGCGGDEGPRLTKAQYEPKLRAEGTALNRAFRNANRAATKPGSDAKAIGQLAEQMEASADNLGDLNPPAEVEAPHDTLVDALHKQADALEDIREATEEGDPAEIREANERFGRLADLQRARQAIRQLRGSGYDVGPLGQR